MARAEEIVDIATLTGACIISLGPSVAGDEIEDIATLTGACISSLGPAFAGVLY
ncbi:hypothetical protein T484DRAFT_1825523 [Baffinella frigidus]|nr:hypothetical protein T484DRAFT_1825523 [Cryptophyta sp. CCMP2293]